MDPIWVLGPIFGGVAGYFFGQIMRERSFTYNVGWVYTYVIFGALWGLSAAVIHAQSNKDKYKGDMYSIQSFRESHAKAVEKIGLTVGKMYGTTEHGHRHAYGQRGRKADARCTGNCFSSGRDGRGNQDRFKQAQGVDFQ